MKKHTEIPFEETIEDYPTMDGYLKFSSCANQSVVGIENNKEIFPRYLFDINNL